jgi:membrane associated rhomboid family serine protease
MYVAHQITGTFFGKSKIIYLADYGGLTLEGIKNFEIWRLFSSQLIHVHQKHMIYNVLSILVLGIILEIKVGHKYILAIWLLAGISGTFFSTQFGSPPWNIGTGASQAAFGFAGFLVVLALNKPDNFFLIVVALAFALIPSLYLDFKSVGYPKPGHILSFVIGFILAIQCYKSPASSVDSRSS